MRIGILVYCKEENYLGCVLMGDSTRIRAFHPQAYLEFLRDLKVHFEQQAGERRHDIEDFLRELQGYSNMIQLAPARTCFLRDPQAEIRQLSARYAA